MMTKKPDPKYWQQITPEAMESFSPKAVDLIRYNSGRVHIQLRAIRACHTSPEMYNCGGESADIVKARMIAMIENIAHR